MGVKGIDTCFYTERTDNLLQMAVAKGRGLAACLYKTSAPQQTNHSAFEESPHGEMEGRAHPQNMTEHDKACIMGGSYPIPALCCR